MEEKSTEMTAPELADMVGAAVKAALEPLTKRTGDIAGMLEKASDHKPVRQYQKGQAFGRAARLIALGKGDPERGAFYAKRSWGLDADGDPVVDYFAKGSLQAGTANAAGNLILPAWSQEFIELLRNRSVFGRIPGVRTVTMPSGSMTFRRQTAAGTAAYVGESTNATNTTQTVGTLTLSAKKLVAITAVSNDLLRQAGNDADMFVRDDLLQIVSLKRDYSFLHGTGLAGEPKGVSNWIAAANSFAQGGTALTNINSDYGKLIRLLEAANIPVDTSNSAFVLSAQVKWAIQKAYDTTAGNAFFRDELSQGRIFGFPCVTSEQVGTTTSFFVHGPSCLIGETLNMQLEAFDGAAYYDSDAAAVVSGVSRDETAIRVIDEHDFALRHDLGAAKITSVTIS